MNITIRMKLIAGFLFVSMIGVFIGYISIASIEMLSDGQVKMYDKITVPLTQIGNAETLFNKIRMKVRDAVLSSKDPQVTAANLEMVKKLEKQLTDETAEFAKTLLTEDGKKILDIFNESFKDYMVVAFSVTDLAMAGKTDEAYAKMREQHVVDVSKKADEALKATVEIKKKIGKLVMDENTAAGHKAQFQMTAAMITGFLMSIFLGLFISSGISKVIKQIMDECGTLSVAVVNGKLDKRCDAEKTNFEFRAITTGINNVMDAFMRPLNVTAEYVDRISKGDIPPKITDVYHGDFNEIKVNLNQCIDSVNALIAEANHLSDAALAGDFSTRADESKHSGDFRKVIKGMNETVNAFTGPLVKTVEHLENLSNGIVDETITRDYNGEFNRLKVSFNKCFAAVNLLIADSKALAKAAVEGKLNTRADASKHTGDFEKIVTGFNDTLDAVIKPVQEGVKCLEEMSHGNLAVEMTGDYMGDHAVLKNALNSTIDSINEILTQVLVSVEHVNTGAKHVAEGSQSLSQAATEQASSLEEISASLQEINTQTSLNADNATHANQLSSQMRGAAETGNVKMKQMLSAMSEINESAMSISKIIKAIDEIAFQTNLLALNAAVEAARAGKHGKGFTVVAEEVRNLAQRSAKAAKETAEMIENSIKKTEIGTGIADQTSKSLQEIVDNVTKTTDIIGEIASASKEQSLGIGQINQGIGQIDRATQQNTATAEESAAASEELSSQAVELRTMLSKFRLKNNDVRVNAYVPEKETIPAKALKTSRSNIFSESKKVLQFAGARVNPKDVISLDDREFGKF